MIAWIIANWKKERKKPKKVKEKLRKIEREKEKESKRKLLMQKSANQLINWSNSDFDNFNPIRLTRIIGE